MRLFKKRKNNVIQNTNQNDNSGKDENPVMPDSENYNQNSTNAEIDNATKFLNSYVNQNRNTNHMPNVKSPLAYDVIADIKKADHEALNTVLLDCLSPELQLNEQQKRTFKQRLMKYIIVILSIQLGFFLLIVLMFAFSFCFKTSFTNNISIEQLKHIIDFLKYYICAIIAEFIAMLFFIVKFVFDKSIVVLIKQLFKKDN